MRQTSQISLGIDARQALSGGITGKTANTGIACIAVAVLLAATAPAAAGQYLGRIGSNPFCSDCTANEFALISNPFNPNSPRNAFGKYGSPFSPYSAANPFATRTPKVYGGDDE